MWLFCAVRTPRNVESKKLPAGKGKGVDGKKKCAGRGVEIFFEFDDFFPIFFLRGGKKGQIIPRRGAVRVPDS